MLKNINKITRNSTYSKILLPKTLIFAILFSIVFSLSGCSLIPKEEEVLAPKLKEPAKVVYDTVEIKNSTFEKKVEITGSLISTIQKDLSFQNSSGRLKTINVVLGTTVKKGDILAELMTDNLEPQIKEQELVLKKSQLALEAIKINNQKDTDISGKQIASLKKKLENMLSISDAYSKEEIKNFREQIEEKEIVFKNSIDMYSNNIKAVENDIALSQLKLDTLRQTFDSNRLTATMDGTVVFLAELPEGSIIDAYTTVVSIADPKALQLSYSGDKVNEFQLGMKVSVKIQDFTTEGEIVMTPANVPSDANEITKSTIRIKLPKLPPDTLVGTYAEITLFQIKKENVIVINKNLIRIAGERKFVSVLENGLKKERDIETGDENQTEIVVVKGLSVGDLVIK